MSDKNFRRLLAHSTWLRPMARALVRDEHVAEDLLQETYLAALEKPPEKAPVRAWLGGVLRNRARMHFRGSARRSNREVLAARTEVSDGPNDDERLELRLDLVHSLLDLEEPYRSTLILRFYDDLTPSEIAEAEGIPAATVRVRLKRGLDRLRESYDKRNRAGLLILFLVAEFPDVDASVLWNELESEAARSASATAFSRYRWISIGAPLLLVLVLVVGYGGGSALSEGREATAPMRRTPLAFELAEPRSRARVSTSVDRIEPAEPSKEGPSIDSREALTRIEVHDARGEPVPAAVVSTGERRLERDQISTGFANAIEFLLRDPTPTILGATDASGSLQIPTRIARQEPLSVRAAGHRVHTEGPTVRDLSAGVHHIVLADPIPTVVRVRGERGRAVTEVRLTRITHAVPSGPDAVIAGDDAWETTIEERISLVRAESVGFAAVQDFLTAPRCEIELRWGETARGRVVDAAGRPVAGAKIGVRSLDWRGPAAMTSTDLNGRFETIAVPITSDGELTPLTVEIDHPRFAKKSVRFETPTRSLEPIVLEPGFTAAGVILDDSGRPLESARVLVIPEDLSPRDIHETQTNEHGEFTLDHLQVARVVLRAEAPEDRRLCASETTLVLGGTETRDIRLALEPAVLLAGVVRTPNGEHLHGVPVRIGAIVGDELRGDLVTTDDEGRFSVRVPTSEIRHRARRSMLRWRSLSEESRSTATRTALLELFLPHQLVSVDGTEVESLAHYGSRNTAPVALDRRPGDEEIEIVVEPLEPTPPVEFRLVDSQGNAVLAFTNVLIASPAPWSMKDFAGLEGRPMHLPNPRVLDDAVVTVMARGYPWASARIDLARSGGIVEVTLPTPFEKAPTLVVDPPRELEILVSPVVDGRSPTHAIPVGRTQSDGSLDLIALGPGRYRVSTPRDPEDVFRKNGRRRTSLPIDETVTIGDITVTPAEHQSLILDLSKLDLQKPTPPIRASERTRP